MSRSPSKPGDAWPWSALKRLAGSPTRGAERAVLLAATAWADRGGVLRPALPNWAALAGVDERTLRRVLRKLAKRGIVEELDPSRGGPRRTSRYRVPLLAENPNPGVVPPLDAIEPGRPVPLTGASDPSNGGVVSANGGVVPPEQPERPREQPPQPPAAPSAAAAVVADFLARHRLTHLRDEPGASPDRLTRERMAALEHKAKSARDSSAWIAHAIRTDFDLNPPPRDPAAPDEARLRRRAFVMALDPGTRDRLIDAARQRFPNLADPGLYPAEHAAVRGAVDRTLVKDPAWAARFAEWAGASGLG